MHAITTAYPRDHVCKQHLPSSIYKEASFGLASLQTIQHLCRDITGAFVLPHCVSSFLFDIWVEAKNVVLT